MTMTRFPSAASAVLLLSLAACRVEPIAPPKPTAPPGAAASLRIEVTGRTEWEGTLRATLHGTRETFRSDAPSPHAASSLFAHGEGVVEIAGIEPGTWALKVHLDLDGDGKVDRRLGGIPSEPVAFGNDAPMEYGPPPFEKCLVKLGPGPNTVRLRLSGSD